jgi:phosphate-selective porin OprO/OprP
MDAAVIASVRLGVLLMLAVAASSAAAEPVEFEFQKSPQLRFGRWLEVNVHGRLQTDLRRDVPADSVKLERAHLSFKGSLLKDWEFQIERELRPGHQAWLDTYIHFDRFRSAEIRAGHFKMPFGMDRLNSVARLDFVYRSRIGTVLSPGRDTGLQVEGRIFRQVAGYQLGVFRHDGDNVRSGARSIAARLTASPLRIVARDHPAGSMEFGAAIAHGIAREGLSSYEGETMWGDTFFDSVPVSGNRRRLGADWKWFTGPFSARSEWIEVREQRRKQDVTTADLPDLLMRGWYVSGTWLVTGEEKTANTQPRGGFGALELAGRLERIGFGSATNAGIAYRSLRAANLGRATDRIVTVGVNWYLNRFVKIQFNVIREKVSDSVKGGSHVPQPQWSEVLRVQFAM